MDEPQEPQEPQEEEVDKEAVRRFLDAPPDADRVRLVDESLACCVMPAVLVALVKQYVTCDAVDTHGQIVYGLYDMSGWGFNALADVGTVDGLLRFEWIEGADLESNLPTDGALDLPRAAVRW
jgi:hypothetical protein